MVCVGITSLETTIWEAIRTKEEHNHPKTPYFPTFLDAWQTPQNSIAYVYEYNKGEYIMIGAMTKEFIYDEFNKLETNTQKVDYLKELKKIKLETPKVISMKISVKHIDRLITEWAKPVPFDKMLSEIKEREEKEKQKELMMRGD